MSQLHGDMIVDTDRGSLTSNAVVLAGRQLVRRRSTIDGVSATLPVRPVRGQLLHLGWTGTPLRRVTWSRRCYLVPWEDGTLLVGATVEEAGFDERTTVAGVSELLEAVMRAGAARVDRAGFWAPASACGRRRRRSAGDRAVRRDAEPVLRDRPLPQRRPARAADGALVADAMLDNRIDPLLAAVSPSRFGDL